jgi:hypothetical protein
MSPHGHIMLLLLDLNKCFDVCLLAILLPIPPFSPIMNMPKKSKLGNNEINQQMIKIKILTTCQK